MERGPYATAHEFQYKVGTVNLQEPASGGGAASGAAAAVNLQVRGSMYYPTNKPTGAPVIILVHGNHGGCKVGGGYPVGSVPSGGSAPGCTEFNRNDQGYSYLAENLATWGYAVASIDQDQLMSYQDQSGAKGMHQRRLMIAAQLDGLYEANQAPVPLDADHNLEDRLVGKLDFTKIGLMGHSRGGDAVTSFMDYNRTRPAPGRKYHIAGVISLAPVDYERRAPYGSAYLTILPACDGDVSNLQGARFYERGQRVDPGDPFPKIQMYLHGANHGNFNTVWSADSDDAWSGDDPACGARTAVPTFWTAQTAPTPADVGFLRSMDPRPVNSTSIRLSGGVDPTGVVNSSQQVSSFLATYNRGTAFSPDPALMGDQEKIGLATMNAFFRRYVGDELAFEPYMTGELTAETGNNTLPDSACPTSPTGTRIACKEYLLTSYFAGATERLDVIDPAPDTALTESALGTTLEATGFANPYTGDGGVQPKPAKTTSGLDWCNPEPDHFTPQLMGQPGVPTAAKGCPLPNPNALGGQANSRREQAPVNESYGNQLAVAWESKATLATRVPAAKGDVSSMKSLTLGAAVNFFDPRNPDRTAGDGLWNPAATTQDFAIELTDAAGKTASVSAGNEKYGNALHQTIGNSSARVHIVLSQVRVPLADFASQGVDLTKVRKVSFVFGDDGYPATGSIQLSDVRFQELATGPVVTYPSVEPRVSLASARVSEADVISASAAPKCSSDAAPTVKLKAKSAKSRTIKLSGTAADAGCAAGVKTVQVALAKSGSAKKARFVAPTGKLTKLLPKSGPALLVAKGTSKWSLKVAKVPAGSYAITVTAIDASGNVTTKKAGTIKVK